ncbi:hypothetical protein [Ottowia sp.]|uniref:hypothetical protein n=2 Tax=Ottowia sp. TaxID=1898956 RepID=UPI002D1FB9B9|nr:hypothetical protein [Ottowia sp.]
MRQARRPRPQIARFAMIGSLMALLCANAHADLVIPPGASQSLGGGSQNLACTDLIVGGTLDLAGGTLAGVRNVTVQAGGTLILGSGAITLVGNWGNAGTVNAGTGSVSFVDDVACAVPVTTAVVSGNTSFYTLSIASSSGKLYQFSAGSAQSVQSALNLSGTGAPLRIESTTPGTPSADISLAAAGSQALSNLAVRGMSASGQWLAPGQTNQAAGGAVSRWFGIPTVGGTTPVPTLSQFSLAGLALVLAALAAWRRKPHGI